MSVAELLPDPGHPVYGPFWQAASRRALAFQRCSACGYLRWPPAPVCPECLTRGGAWEDVPGGGTVWSVAIYEHAYHPSLRPAVPYACALVELDAGPRLVARLVGVEPKQAEIGMRVRPVYHDAAKGVTLVWFEPDSGLASPPAA